MIRIPQKSFGLLIFVFLLSLAVGFPQPLRAAEEKEVLVFAAASTTNAITDIGRLFAQSAGVKVVPSFASSSTLAKQIDQGAPAQVYLSANPKWMNYLEERNRIVSESRSNLLSNRIVLIAPQDSPVQIAIGPGFPLAEILGEERFAMGDPDHVPAGIYGRQALEALGVWPAVGPKAARTKDVRAALALVERGETPLGLVYATDAAISSRVRVVGVFPEDTHPPITYPVALVAGSTNAAAEDFLKFLQTPEARAIFEKYGFTVVR